MASVPSDLRGGSGADISNKALPSAYHEGRNHAREHFVQFYLDDQALIDPLAAYVREGLEDKAAAIVIAAPTHVRALEAHWRSQDFDTRKARDAGRLLLLDAAETLKAFTTKGTPERERFFEVIGGLVARAASRHDRVIAFGEMVALLWNAGEMEAAIQLEQWWNELALKYSFTLFCAYSMRDCAGHEHIRPLEAVCASHTRVIPAQTYDRLSPHQQQAVIVQLQQKAHVLEKKLREEVQTQQSLAHLAAIVESSDDAIVGITLDGTIRSWNAGAAAIFGWSAQEAIGRSLVSIIPPERLSEEQRILDTLKRGERIEHFETTRMAKDGRRVEVSLTMSPMRDADGRVVGISKIARDITLQKSAERLLYEREKSLREANLELQGRTAELVRFNQAAVDREMRIIELKHEINSLREQLGQSARYPLPSEESVGRIEVLTNDAAPEPRVPLDTILHTEQLRTRPTRRPNYKAENEALKGLIHSLAASPGTILQSLSETIGTLLHAGSSGVSLLTPDNQHFYWAAVAGKWSPAQSSGTPCHCSPCGDVLDRHEPLLFTHWERRYPHLATAPAAEEALVAPFEVNGRTVGTLCAIRHDREHLFDREDLRLLESLCRFAAAAYQAVELVRSADKRRATLNLLEDAVHSRELAEESNRKLRQRDEALREANRRKDEFLALLSHELRNPLAPIRNAGEVLSRLLSDNKRAQSSISIIRRQTTQLTRLVDDLLDVGRITQGRIQLQCETVDLARVIAQARETIQPQIRGKQHKVKFLHAPETLFVKGDFARLVQCVGNVLSNAAKNTDERGEIGIQLKADGSSAIVEITDNGAGIAPELLPRVFDLFVQADRTLDRAQGGLGIGLSVVKRLVEMHNGGVTAHSRGVGQGSRFEIRLPRILSLSAPLIQQTSVTGVVRRVLIVDDNADAANSLALLLGVEGHEARVAFTAEEALSLVETFKPDVALLDIGLPGMDGYELARRLRAEPGLKAMRLVALTGYGQAEDRVQSRQAGFDLHLVKPIDPAFLTRALLPGDAPVCWPIC